MDFVCQDPNAAVRETFVQVIQNALGAIPSLSRRIIEQHALPTTGLSHERFIPLQRALDLLKHVNDEMGPIVLRQAGTYVCETADFPAQVATVEDALMGIDFNFRMHHRGEVGRYVPKMEADGAITIRCATPYPKEFERGIVEGLCRNPGLSKGKRYFVSSQDGAPGSDETCVLTVRAV